MWGMCAQTQHQTTWMVQISVNRSHRAKKGKLQTAEIRREEKRSHWNFVSPHSLGCLSFISYIKGSQTKKQQLKWLCRTYQSTVDKTGTWLYPVLLSFPPVMPSPCLEAADSGRSETLTQEQTWSSSACSLTLAHILPLTYKRLTLKG